MKTRAALFLLGVLFATQAGAAQPGEVWTEPKTGMPFVWVPKGCFKMGTDTLNPPAGTIKPLHNNPKADEMPRHEVCLEGFWIGRFEVTQKEWQQVTGSNPSDIPGHDTRPVEMVTWDEAVRFGKLLGEYAHTKDTFRLPTEAEWEYACRSGGKEGEIYSGSTGDDNDFADYAWSRGTAPEIHTYDVGSKKPNGLGIHDMSGNVHEWVQDNYLEKGYAQHKLQQPLVEVPGGERRFVIRGGSYRSNASMLRCAARGWDFSNDRLHNLGVRLVRVEAKEAKSPSVKGKKGAAP